MVYIAVHCTHTHTHTHSLCPHASHTDSATPRVGLLLTGTPLDTDLQSAFLLAARHSGAEVVLLEGTAADTPEGVITAFTELWQAGVRVFLAGGGVVQTETLCHHLQQTKKKALLVSLTADADTSSCSSNSSTQLVSLSPAPTALLAAEVAGLVEGGATHLVPVLMPSREGESLLLGLKAVAAAWNVSVVSPIYLDAVSPSVMHLDQVLSALPGAAVWLAADHHLPHLMTPLRDVLYDRVVMLHAHPIHLATLLYHPEARAAAETCAITTVQWAGPSRIDDAAHRRLMAILMPTNPLAAALAYHAATLAINATQHGTAHKWTQLEAHLNAESSWWDTAPTGELVVRPTAGWAARLRLVAQHLVNTMVMQDSPFLLEGMTRVQEGTSPSSWQVEASYAPARLLTQEDMVEIGEHTDCGHLVTVEVRAHDPLTHRPVVTAWLVPDMPEAVLIPNFSPRGFTIRAHCQGRAGREVEVGCQGAKAHNESLNCLVVSGGGRQRRQINTFVTSHGLSITRTKRGAFNYYVRKLKGLYKHPDFRAFIPQMGGCIGATSACSYCFVFILWRNVTVNPGVCMGACAVAVGASCSSLVAKGVEYQMSHTVICTELFTQGQLSLDSYLTDAAYGARLAVTNPQALRGYHLLAGPIVSVMQVSPSLTSLVEMLVRPCIRHMEFEEGMVAADDLVGRLVTAMGLPLCSAVATLNDHILTAKLLALMMALTWYVLK